MRAPLNDPTRLGLPSPGCLFFLIVIVAALASPAARSIAINSGDTFMHVRIGGETLASLRVPRVDTFSHTAYGKPYVSHEWLFQVLIALVYRGLGVDGLVLFAAVAGGLLAWLLTLRAEPRTPRALASVALAVAASAFVLWNTWRARPHMITYLGFATGLLVLEREAWRRRGIKTLALTALAFAAWANFHLGVFIFLGLLALDALVLRLQADPDWRWMVALIAAGSAACFVNPYGASVPLQIIDFITHPRLGAQIHEHQPLYLDNPDAVFVVSMLTALAALGALKRGSISAREAPRLVFLAALAFVSRRHAALFVIAATPTVAGAVEAALSWAWRNHDSAAADRAPPAPGTGPAVSLAWAAGAMLATGLALRSLDVPLSYNEYLRHPLHPVAAAKFARAHAAELGPRMFNPYNYGGYLTFALPEFRVYVDGRADFYGLEFIDEYSLVDRGRPGATAILARRQVDWALVEPAGPLRGVLSREKWSLVYEDALAAILVSPARAGQLAR